MTSDKRAVSKTLNQLKECTFDFKDASSVIKPVIVVSSSKALAANYAYIDLLNRYYFIEDAILNSDGRIELHLTVDVLQTYSEQIKNLTTLVERQEKNYSNYIIDSELLTTCDRAVSMSLIGKIGNATGSYIALTVAGGAS
jgi:hypothetical protein